MLSRYRPTCRRQEEMVYKGKNRTWLTHQHIAQLQWTLPAERDMSETAEGACWVDNVFEVGSRNSYICRGNDKRKHRRHERLCEADDIWAEISLRWAVPLSRSLSRVFFFYLLLDVLSLGNFGLCSPLLLCFQLRGSPASSRREGNHAPVRLQASLDLSTVQEVFKLQKKKWLLRKKIIFS